MNKLGIHPFGHDCAIGAIDHKDKDIHAISLEKITRFKHDYRFIEPLLKKYFQINSDTKLVFAMKEVSPERVKHFEKQYAADINFRKYEKILSSDSSNMIKALRVGLQSPKKLIEMGLYKRYLDVFELNPDLEGFSEYLVHKFGVDKGNISYYDHHFSHACSAYYFAPRTFKNSSVVVTLDGQGDKAFCKVFAVENNIPVEKIVSSNNSSIPLLYSLFTYILGFQPSSDEGKLEALACYGNMSKDHGLYKILSEAFIINSDLEIQLRATKEFPFCSVVQQWHQIKGCLISHKNKIGEKDFAAVMQLFFEEFFLKYIKLVKSRFNISRMAFAGGAFANVKLNLRILEEAGLEEIYIFPAIGDDGTTLGALAYSDFCDGIDIEWLRDKQMPYFGPSYTDSEILRTLEHNKRTIAFEHVGRESYRILAQKIAEGRICGLFRGKLEFGPRALGHRSILATPTSREIRDQINLKFKRREWFQPFCPSMLEEERERLLETSYNNKHMTCAFRVKKEFADKIPAVMHIDATARAQFVSNEDDGYYFSLLKELKKITGLGVVLNTSFNIHGKPMVMTPQDAVDDFLSSGIDYLFLEDYLVTRK